MIMVMMKTKILAGTVRIAVVVREEEDGAHQREPQEHRCRLVKLVDVARLELRTQDLQECNVQESTWRGRG